MTSHLFFRLFNLILLLAACYGGFLLFTVAKGSQKKDQSRKKKLRYSDERDHEEAVSVTTHLLNHFLLFRWNSLS